MASKVSKFPQLVHNIQCGMNYVAYNAIMLAPRSFNSGKKKRDIVLAMVIAVLEEV